MKIFSYKPVSLNFKAHTYDIDSKSAYVVINTDNNPYLGNVPYLIADSYNGKKEEIKMEKDKGLYTAKTYVYKPYFNYHIEYKDTNKVDLKDGKEYSLNFDKLKQDAAKRIRTQHRQPLIHAFNEGSAVGKILYKEDFDYKDFDKINEPAIIVTKNTDILSLNNKNILGLIMTDYDAGVLGHSAANLRLETELSAAVLDSESIERLKSFNGKNVEIKVADNILDIKETDKQAVPKTYPKIEIPEMEYCDEILTSDKYSPNLVGAKAVNLRKLEKLAEDGKIDVKIPKSVALPYGYIEKNFSVSGLIMLLENDKDPQMDDLYEKLKENGINTKSFMVRSAFNGEDLPNYSSAGLYRTHIAGEDPLFFYESIIHIVDSKEDRKARNSRIRHGIPDEKIKPSIVIQNRIKPEYKFTLYTEYGEDNLRIDMYSNDCIGHEDYVQPHVFNYDKKNKKLTYVSIQMGCPTVTYDEDLNVIDLPPVKYDLSKDKNLLEQIQKLVDNALVIEQEFGTPQDIEGGLLGDDIYLWQTRNIVKKMKL